MEIGERVRLLRKGRGMTQEDLADATKRVKQVYISRLETGRQKTVEPYTAKALSKALDVSLEYLLFGEEPVQAQSEKLSALDESLIRDEPLKGPSRFYYQTPVQRFLVKFLSLAPSQQAQVMNFTDFIMKSGEDDTEGTEGTNENP